MLTSSIIAQEWCPPFEICTANLLCGIATGYGVVCQPELPPWPIWPKKSSPQHWSVLSIINAQVWCPEDPEPCPTSVARLGVPDW